VAARSSGQMQAFQSCWASKHCNHGWLLACCEALGQNMMGSILGPVVVGGSASGKLPTAQLTCLVQELR
jgi:hypothetical protein